MKEPRDAIGNSVRMNRAWIISVAALCVTILGGVLNDRMTVGDTITSNTRTIDAVRWTMATKDALTAMRDSLGSDIMANRSAISSLQTTVATKEDVYHLGETIRRQIVDCFNDRERGRLCRF
jgi:hypothetical protein